MAVTAARFVHFRYGKAAMRFGLLLSVGQDWDLNTLITNCKAVSMEAVELSQHAHGVETSMNQAQRWKSESVLLIVQLPALAMDPILSIIVGRFSCEIT